jgi:hypothetical protein
MQALEKARPVRGGIPLLFERQRNNVQIVKEKIADYVDPPRFIPLIGMASLHHAHYKCTIYFTERTINGWPVPYTLEDKKRRKWCTSTTTTSTCVATQTRAPAALLILQLIG